MREDVAGGVAESVVDRRLHHHRQRQDEEEEPRRGGPEQRVRGRLSPGEGDGGHDCGASDRDPGRGDAERRAHEERDGHHHDRAHHEPGEPVERDRFAGFGARRGRVRRSLRSAVPTTTEDAASVGSAMRSGEATEAEAGGREHEEVGEVRHRQEARRRVRELGGREQRRVGARAALRDQRHHHRREEHRGGIEAHEHGDQRPRPQRPRSRAGARCGPARSSTRRRHGTGRRRVRPRRARTPRRGTRAWARGGRGCRPPPPCRRVRSPRPRTAPVPATRRSGKRPHATSARTATSTSRLATVPTGPHPTRIARALDKSR